MSQAIPAKNKLGYEHYVCFPDDGRRHEIIAGDHYMNPAPTTDHQRYSRRIQFQIYNQVEESGRGEVFNAPADVQFTDHDIVQPDLIVVMRERRLIITPTKIKGTPDLIVEILSASTKQNDRVLKRNSTSESACPNTGSLTPITMSWSSLYCEGANSSLRAHMPSAFLWQRSRTCLSI